VTHYPTINNSIYNSNSSHTQQVTSPLQSHAKPIVRQQRAASAPLKRASLLADDMNEVTLLIGERLNSRGVVPSELIPNHKRLLC